MDELQICMITRGSVFLSYFAYGNNLSNLHHPTNTHTHKHYLSFKCRTHTSHIETMKHTGDSVSCSFRILPESTQHMCVCTASSSECTTRHAYVLLSCRGTNRLCCCCWCCCTGGHLEHIYVCICVPTGVIYTHIRCDAKRCPTKYGVGLCEWSMCQATVQIEHNEYVLAGNACNRFWIITCVCGLLLTHDFVGNSINIINVGRYSPFWWGIPFCDWTVHITDICIQHLCQFDIVSSDKFGSTSWRDILSACLLRSHACVYCWSGFRC